jgi:hypothetical protein
MSLDFEKLLLQMQSPEDQHTFRKLVQRNEVLRSCFVVVPLDKNDGDRLRELEAEYDEFQSEKAEWLNWYSKSKKLYESMAEQNRLLQSQNQELDVQVKTLLLRAKPVNRVLYQSAGPARKPKK